MSLANIDLRSASVLLLCIAINHDPISLRTRSHPAGQALTLKNRSPESKRKSLIRKEIEK